MKIAIVVPGGVDRSGERRVVPALLALIARLSARHELQVFALAQQPQADSWNLAGAQIHNIGGRVPLPGTVTALWREHARRKFEVVQAFWAGQSGLAAAVAARRMRVPYAVHLAGGELAELPRIGYGGRQRAHWRVLDPWTLRRAAAVTAASAGIIELAARLGVSAERLPLGVALDAWPPLAPRPRAPETVPRLIHVASLNAVKDQATMLRAVARLRDAGQPLHLDVVGEDTLGGALQALAAELGLGGCVQFHGFLTQRQLRPLVESAHLNVVSSLHEAGPLVVLEAAALGVPTVGTAVGHVAEWAPQAALAVPPGDATALSGAMRRLIEDEPLRLELARNALQRATAEDADFTARRFEELYVRIAGG